MVLTIGQLRPHNESEIKHIESSDDTRTLQTGDIVETFDHVIEWDADCVSIEQCASWRSLSDDTCDAALREAFTGPSSTVGKDLLGSLASLSQESGRTQSSVQRFLDHVNAEPPETLRVSEEEVTVAQEFFLDNSIQIMQALLHYSLAGGFASPRIVRTLEAVSYLVPHVRRGVENAHTASLTEALSKIPKASTDRTLSRLFETFQFVLDVMGCSAQTGSVDSKKHFHDGDAAAPRDRASYLMPGGEGWHSAVRVRLLHGVARWRVEERWAKNGSKEEGVPISQEDLAATLASFSTIPIWSLHRLGLAPSDEQASAYLALWRHVGYYLGVDPQILQRYFTSTKTADKFLASVALHLFSDGPLADPREGPPSTILRGPTIPILVAVSDRPPLYTSIEYNIALTAHLLGPSLSAHLGLPPMPLRARLRMHAFLFLQRIPHFVARYYPRRRWLEKRRIALREGMVRTLYWNLGMRKTTYRPRTMVQDVSPDDEDGPAKGGELAPNVAEEEAVKPDPTRTKALTKMWSEVWKEMVAVCAVSSLVAGISAYLVLAYLVHCFWF
ncbi:hypothetical protein PYCCODRAFT_328980 [Trametes coccinea BRFM310]|uniref:ER-bound oxygenase mpaB/mpaB'/Rubber oxygenase catalytic domain-containing protein n=1 Tax=Trametes coccinea (strain BRFM310) TaxID=1353009 RepID=A0A1Y2INF4_TRAC3|nr:hypothetical protein PYCCODRAFT_328980 [Trametes coccinea BRFM310]